MDKQEFKDALRKSGLSNEQFADLLGIKVASFRVQLSRHDTIPDEWVRLIDSGDVSDAPRTAPVSEVPQASKTPQTSAGKKKAYEMEVIRPFPGSPEFDIMEDGFARGFPGDTNLMRAYHRTSHAFRRILEVSGNVDLLQTLPPIYKLDSKGRVVK